MPWSPDYSLGTVTEGQSFSYGIQYYDETIIPGAVNPDNGIAGEDIVNRIYYPVTLTQIEPRSTVSISDGDPAIISGNYINVYNDVIQYRNFNDNIITLVGDSSQGTWDKFDINSCYQFVSFKADTTRDRTFNISATAKNGNTIISTATFSIRVHDRSWTPGLNRLRNIIATLRLRGV